MSGIIAVYSLVIAVLIAEDMRPPNKNEGNSYSLFKYVRPVSLTRSRHSFRRLQHLNSLEIYITLHHVSNPRPMSRDKNSTDRYLTGNSSFMHLGCGIAVGMTGLAAGYCIGVVGDKGVRAYMEQSRVFVGMVLILIFGEVLGLYGYVPSKTNLNYGRYNTIPCNPPFLFVLSASLITSQPHRRAYPEHKEQGLSKPPTPSPLLSDIHA